MRNPLANTTTPTRGEETWAVLSRFHHPWPLPIKSAGPHRRIIHRLELGACSSGSGGSSLPPPTVSVMTAINPVCYRGSAAPAIVHPDGERTVFKVPVVPCRGQLQLHV